MAQPSYGLRELFTRNRLRASVVLICLISSAILWTGLLVQLNFEGERIIESKRHENDNLAKVFEEHVARTIRAAEVTLREIASEYRRYGTKFDLVQYAKDRRTYLDPYNVLSISSEKGDLEVASIPPPRPMNFSKLSNYKYHLDHDTPDLFISEPRIGTTTGKRSVYLSTRWNKMDGSFGGEATIAMDPFYFTRIYTELELGKDAVVTLLKRDGTILARVRNSGAEMTAGQNVVDTRLFTNLLPAEHHGSFIGASPVDGVTRINSYRALKDYPLVVVIGTSRAVALMEYDRHRSAYMQAAAAMTAVILCLGLFALFQIARSDRSNEALRFSEEKFSKAFHASPDWVVLSKRDTGEFLEVNEGFERISGYSREEVIGRTAIQLGIWVRPDQRAVLVGQLASGGAVRNVETVFRRKGGEERVIQISLEAIDLGGEKCMLAVGSDVTELKHNEDALRSYATRLRELSRRLQEVEATERNAISRELHDRIGQGLTTLSLMVGTLGTRLPEGARNAVQTQLEDMQALLRSVVANVRDVMAELRPPALDDYGLFVALRHLVTEFAKCTGIAVNLSGVDLNPRLPLIVETAMYRISQEALNNAAKHAQAKQVAIGLHVVSERIVLDIADDGVGFDPDDMRHGGEHWGMITMRERAEAVGITLRLESTPGAGTWVVLEAERVAT